MYDLSEGCYHRYDNGKGDCGSETCFAPSAGATFDAAEDDGYPVKFVHYSANCTSKSLVFHTRNLII